MDPTELILILALVGYSVWKQSQKNEVIGNRRFKLAIIYAIIGLIAGGLRPPTGFWPILVLVISVALSLGVGLLRGRFAKVWAENGRVYSQGTPLTIGLFLGLIVLKFVIGFLVWRFQINSDAGMGEIMIMIAIMIAIYAEIIWRRAEPLGARQSTTADEPAHPL